MSAAGQCPESAGLPVGGGATALARWQPVLRGNSQVIFYCHQAGGFWELIMNEVSVFFYRLPLYQALFTSFRQCLIERQVPVLLPGVMMKGQAQVQVSLYHHVCVHLCASVAALPPECFSVLVSFTRFQSGFLKLKLNEFFLFIIIFTCRLKSLAGFRDLFPMFLRSYQWQELSCFLQLQWVAELKTVFWFNERFFPMILFLLACDQQKTALGLNRLSFLVFVFAHNDVKHDWTLLRSVV